MGVCVIGTRYAAKLNVAPVSGSSPVTVATSPIAVARSLPAVAEVVTAGADTTVCSVDAPHAPRLITFPLLDVSTSTQLYVPGA